MFSPVFTYFLLFIGVGSMDGVIPGGAKTAVDESM